MQYFKNKNVLIIISFILGLLVMALIQKIDSHAVPGRMITYLQKLEVTQLTSSYITVKGSYVDSTNDINLISLECYLDSNVCIENPVFITEEGVAGTVGSKQYEIIEKSPTRIVAKFEGTAAFHMYTIDLATKKITFKNESNTNTSDVAIYELEDGDASLAKSIK